MPPHLRHLIVQQDYSRYTAIDQAVWRFVLLQTHARLKATAHVAYREGLGQTGISVERIPSISEMDTRLEPFGWGALCVDGFIPPRAFQELQSLSILPIAADMRTVEHLVYTPAPDIIHEAAGHAPILPDPTYASYLRRLGAAGARAFTSPDDARVDRAIHLLSEVKEDSRATPEQVARAEAALGDARRRVRRVSEAARLSRLYWWTAEYGLIGSPSEYKLFGAGLLSSLWESFACHDPAVKKLPLSSAVTELDYDVTQPQPQLFVTPTFEALHETLDEVTSALASARGGEDSVLEALEARELSTLTLVGGSILVGRLERRLIGQGRSRLLELSGPARAALGAVSARTDDKLFALLGWGSPNERAVQSGSLDLRWEGGARLSGAVRLREPGATKSESMLVMESGLLTFGTDQIPLPGGTVVVLANAVDGVVAGAPADFYTSTDPPPVAVPRPRSFDERERRLLSLYEEALVVWSSRFGTRVAPAFARLHRELQQHFKDDWLLRWNLLESLTKLDERGPLWATLHEELEVLEIRHLHRQPIASGLKYLSSVAGLSPDDAAVAAG